MAKALNLDYPAILAHFGVTSSPADLSRARSWVGFSRITIGLHLTTPKTVSAMGQTTRA